jgi:AmiR/NasT family two-component response regulator
MFAAQSAILVANVRTFENARKLSEALADSLRGRDVINMAKGIIMAREHVDEGTAFALLAGNAREESRKVRDLAGSVVRSTVRHDR